MKSMICLVVIAFLAAVSAHPGGLTGVPYGSIALGGGGLGWGAPKVQPIAPSVKSAPLGIYTVPAPAKTLVSAPLIKAPLISLQPQILSGKAGLY